MTEIKNIHPYNYEAETFSILSLQEFIQERTSNSVYINRGIRYAHPIDKNITKILDSIPFRTFFNSILNSVISLEYGQKYINSIHVSALSFPEIYKSLVDCSSTLDIAIPRLILNHGDLNAMTTGTDNKCFIELSTMLTSLTSNEELKFIIGHECGHIHNQHVSYNNLLRLLLGGMFRYSALPIKLVMAYLSPAIQLALNAWSRRAEITADRAGLLSCGDIRVAEMALVRLVLGFEKQEKLDFEEFLDQLEIIENERSQAVYSELFASHPFIFKRIKALRLFSASEMYHDITGKLPTPSNLLNDAQLNLKVEEIVGVFSEG
jgi:hypothetical protein